MEGRGGVVPWPTQSPILNPSEATDIRNKLGCMDGNTGWYKWRSNGWHFEHVTITLKLNTLFEMTMMIKVR
jgi:hypothetical protein